MVTCTLAFDLLISHSGALTTYSVDPGDLWVYYCSSGPTLMGVVVEWPLLPWTKCSDNWTKLINTFCQSRIGIQCPPSLFQTWKVPPRHCHIATTFKGGGGRQTNISSGVWRIHMFNKKRSSKGMSQLLLSLIVVYVAVSYVLHKLVFLLNM